MEWMIAAYLFVLGLFIGSFLNVVAIRIPRKESIVFPPSHCPHCQHRLGVRDLIPVLGFLLLRGRCRYCGQRISFLYPLGEAAAALLFLSAYLQLGLSLELAVALLLASLLVTITLSDWLYQIIPDKVLLFFFVVLAGLRLFSHPLPFSHYLLGMLLGFGLFWLLAAITRGGMGGGDIKLMGVLGITLGWKLTLLAIFLASLLGSIVGGGLILSGKIQRRTPIPFGPFLAVGAWVAYLWGENLIQVYLSWLERVYLSWLG